MMTIEQLKKHAAPLRAKETRMKTNSHLYSAWRWFLVRFLGWYPPKAERIANLEALILKHRHRMREKDVFEDETGEVDNGIIVHPGWVADLIRLRGIDKRRCDSAWSHGVKGRPGWRFYEIVWEDGTSSYYTLSFKDGHVIVHQRTADELRVEVSA